MKLVVKPEAQTDLIAIAEYIAMDNPTAAERMIDQIMQTCKTTLLDNPLIGRARDIPPPGLRSFPVRPYIIFYRPTDAAIDIIRVLHGARDIETILAP